ncbi:MAG: glutamine-hydrolyzing carbamoyl-phosphate synthase small subunit, partial [Pseudomonadota bacterium]
MSTTSVRAFNTPFFQTKELAVLALEDGSIFEGISIGAPGETHGEVVFNTSMTGYQEILTDPSYSRQIVTLTYPHIGNTGVNLEDIEANKIHAAGLIIKELSQVTSNFRSNQSLSNYLKAEGVIGIAGIDTRRLTRLLREKGTLHGAILVGGEAEKALALSKAFPGLVGMDLAKIASTHEAYEWTETEWQLKKDDGEAGYGKQTNPKYHVAVYDYGVKRNILRMLAERGCRLTVFPAQTPVDEVLALNPDGVFLSNGPGDPEPCDYAIDTATSLMEKKIPLFGICLGHQIMAHASGAKTL